MIINWTINKLFSRNLNGFVLHFTDVLAFYPGLRFAINDSIVRDIRSYLGPLCKLDAAYLGYFNSSSDLPDTVNTSSKYHHDSVGHRLKLFVPLNSFGNIPFPTKYLEGSNLHRWQNFQNPVNSAGDRVCNSIINSSSENTISIPYGKQYIFDTNGLHKGVYNKSQQNRLILQFEFSTHFINPFGQVGPMSFSLSQTAFEYFQSFKLLTKGRFKRENSVFNQKGLRHRDFDESCARISDYMLTWEA